MAAVERQRHEGQTAEGGKERNAAWRGRESVRKREREGRRKNELVRREGVRESDKGHRIMEPSARVSRQKLPSFIIENAYGVEADLIARLAIPQRP